MSTKGTRAQRRWISRMAAGLALVGGGLTSGCTTPWGNLGAVDEDGSTTDETGATSVGEDVEDVDDESTGVEPPPSCTLDVGPSLTRGILRVQYENTVHDVLGLPAESWSPAAPWNDLFRDWVGPFETNVIYEASELAGAYRQIASTAAEAIDPQALLPCDPSTPDPDACAEQLVTTLGRRLWRRPLEPAEVQTLLEQYQGTDLVEGTRGVVEALLASPNLWILQETGTPWTEDPDVTALDSWSLATRMAFFLWNSTPDEPLLALAEAGMLSDPTVRLTEADRMLADPRAERMLGQLYRSLLRAELDLVEKDAELFPAYGPSMAAAMEHELQLFVSDVVLHGDGRIDTLLNAPFTYVDAQLLALYGNDVTSDPGALEPGQFARVDLDPARRGGALTLPAVMTGTSHPWFLGWVARGKLVREEILCQMLPPPPPDVDTVPPQPDESAGRYERWAEFLQDPVCMACHELTDPISFAFEEYDPIGQWQTEIDGEPVQTAGELVGVTSGTQTFSGRAELTEILPTLPEANECAVRQHLRFALRRELDESDQCAVDQLTAQVTATDGNLRVLLRSVVVAEHFGLVRPQ